MRSGARQSAGWLRRGDELGHDFVGSALARYPDTYNKQPLMYAALASQKNYMSLYLMSVYAHSDDKAWFETRYKASGKRLNMGKSCVRFKRVDDLPLDLIAETIASTTVDEYISRYESARKK